MEKNGIKLGKNTDDFCGRKGLAEDVDSTKIEATLKNGVLYLTLPKHEAAKPKRITIT